MSAYNWGHIQTWQTFERLVHLLVQHIDQNAHGFGRPGPDGGQDAISGDCTTVYSAKYHEISDAQYPIKDALAELSSITKYRERGHPRHEQWEGVTRWILVTNVEQNPTTVQNWKSKVTGPFADIGLESTLWTRERLETHLSDHPQIADTFFEGLTAILWTVAQARQEAMLNEPLSQGFAVEELVGRSDEQEQIRRFGDSEESRFLVVQGPGGVGKSRLLFEASRDFLERGWQVYWLNELEFNGRSDLYRGFIPERRTLLVVDEPERTETIERLIRELGTNERARDWKLLCAVRSAKDNFLAPWRSLRDELVAPSIQLNPLSKPESMKLTRAMWSAASLLELGEDELSQVFRAVGGFPMWIAVAATMMARGTLAKLPSDKWGFAELYVREAVSAEHRDVLGWLCLLQPIPVDGTATQEVVALETGTNVDVVNDILSSLHHTGLVRRRRRPFGGGSHYLITPDVIRDALLRNWLTRPKARDSFRREATNRARKLMMRVIGAEFDLVQGKRAIDSLVRLESVCEADSPPGETSGIDLLGPYLEHLGAIARDGSTGNQLVIFELLDQVCFRRPEETLCVLHTLMQCDRGEYSDLSGHVSTHLDVLNELPWAVSKLARYAPEGIRRDIVKMLSELARRDLGASYGGKGARQFLEQLVANEDGWGPDYSRHTLALTLNELHHLTREETLNGDSQGFIRALTAPQLRVERSRTRAYESKVVFERYTLPREMNFSEYRNFRSIVSKLKEVLESAASSENKAVAWNLLTSARVEANRAEIRKKKNDEQSSASDAAGGSWEDEVIELLRFTLDCLKSHAPQMLAEELIAAREIWDWYHRFGSENDPATVVARECEDIFKGTQHIGDLAALYENEERQDSQGLYEQKARELAESSAETLRDFVERSHIFLSQRFNKALAVARRLGRDFNPSSAPWLSYLLNTLAQPAEGHSQFVRALLLARNYAMQEAEPAKLLEEMVFWDERMQQEERLNFSSQLFSSPKNASLLSLLRRQIEANVFAEIPRETTTKLIATFLPHGFGGVEELLNLLKIPLRESAQCFGALLDVASTWIDEINLDTLDRLIRYGVSTVANFGMLGSNDQYYLERVLERHGKYPALVFGEFVDLRLQLLRQHTTTEQDRVYVLSGSLSKFCLVDAVQPIEQKTTELESLLERLLDEVAGENIAVFALQHELPRLDPLGLILPKLITERLHDSSDGAFVSWARFACVYSPATEAWRQIARVALDRRSSLPEKERQRLEYALLNPSISIGPARWASEIDPQYKIAVERAMERVADEETILQDFWRRELTRARQAYERALAELQEEQEEQDEQDDF